MTRACWRSAKTAVDWVKLRRRIRTVLQWARAHGHVTRNVAGEDIDGTLPAMPAVKAHLRALPYYQDSRLRWRTSRRRGPRSLCGSASGFVVLTACRSGEARGATWGGIDLDTREWRIPASSKKAGAEFRAPLSDAAVAVLESVRPLRGPAGLVFPGPRRPGNPR